MEASTKQEQTGNHADTDNECKDCLPFFSCGSCVGFITEDTKVLELKENGQDIFASYPLPTMSEPETPVYTIWQPPRLG